MAAQDQARTAGRRDTSGSDTRPMSADGLPGRQAPTPPAPELSPSPTVAEHVIAEAAYYRWQREGGDARANWLAAEHECRGRAATGLDGS